MIGGKWASLAVLVGLMVPAPALGGQGLIRASEKGDRDRVVRLLETADLDAQDRRGRTALMYAALHGHDDVVDMLLKAGADVHLHDEYGQTALNGALRWGGAR